MIFLDNKHYKLWEVLVHYYDEIHGFYFELYGGKGVRHATEIYLMEEFTFVGFL